MAVDTEDKRRSIPFIVGLPGLSRPPVPDGDLADAEDRMQIAGFYAGISPTAPAIGGRRRRILLGVY